MLRLLASLTLAGFAVSGCIRVAPIHVTVDVNVNVKIDKALDDFFGDLDKKSATLATPATKS
jgi:hypothetical protein